MIPARAHWYWRRLRRMSADEVVSRARDQARRALWATRQVRPGTPGSLELVGALPGPRGFATPLPDGAVEAIPGPARDALVAAASVVADGRWDVLGVERSDLIAPDWFLDPLTSRRAPHDRYCFRVNHRSEAETGNVKQVWELSRHHHLTLLAAAWFVTGEGRYATVVDRQLRDWWRKNPFLSGVHWTSGIELGIRLISWAWIRRLLDGWPGVVALFEENDDAVCQIGWHQEYLAAFPSGGTSANNHVIAEAAGQVVAACAFPWFGRSDRWRTDAADLLTRQLGNNTFPSGLNREQASEYHGFVAELGLVAAAEAAAAGHPLGDGTRGRLARMVDAAAAVVDERLRSPRQGDGDDGRVLVVDGQGSEGWASLLAAGAALVGPQAWWPAATPDVRSCMLASLAGVVPRAADAIQPVQPVEAAGEQPGAGRERARPSHFPDAGLTVLRTEAAGGPEIWCRCDAGPHGFLGIAAHAHADALSVEVRHGGVDVLADPGTYCYHGEPEWRAYFRSTIGHNTLELAGQDQSRSGGPFLWVRQAQSRLLQVDVRPESDVVSWSAEHYGYATLEPPAVHRRSVSLDRGRRRLEIIDTVVSDGCHPCRLAFHLGPAVEVSLDGAVAALRWPGAVGASGASATLYLPSALTWSVHRGESDPVLGWYSPRFGVKEPAATLVGTGSAGEGMIQAEAPEDRGLVTVLQF